MRLSPFDIDECNVAQFIALYTSRRYEDALLALGRIPDPGYEVGAFRCACYAQLGRDAEARQALDTFMAQKRLPIGQAKTRRLGGAIGPTATRSRTPAIWSICWTGFTRPGCGLDGTRSRR